MAIDFQGLKAATFNTPKNYKESVEYYKRNLQDKIDDVHEFSSDTFDIGFEEVEGTLEFKNIVCRINHAINPKTGHNLGDDFKDLKFFDVYSNRYMGQRYRFDDNIWITTNTDNYHYATQSAIVRRCNNVLSYITPDGQIVREPCIIGYSIKYANIYYNTTADIPQGTVVVTAQSNKFTQNVEINDRFILNKQTFKVKSITDYLRSNTEGFLSTPIIEMEMFVDAIAPDDDFYLGVANMNRYKGLYPVRPQLPDDIVVEPALPKLYQGDRQEFSCYQFIDGVKQNTKFSFTPSNALDRTYEFKQIDDNHFEVYCLGRSTRELIVYCKYNSGGKEFKLKLGGLY